MILVYIDHGACRTDEKNLTMDDVNQAIQKIYRNGKKKFSQG